MAAVREHYIGRGLKLDWVSPRVKNMAQFVNGFSLLGEPAAPLPDGGEDHLARARLSDPDA